MLIFNFQQVRAQQYQNYTQWQLTATNHLRSQLIYSDLHNVGTIFLIF